MNEIKYNDQVTLGYETKPIYASSNVVTGTKYITHLYLLQGSSRYPLGTWYEKLDEDTIKYRFAEIMYSNRERQYGQQNTVLRKDLKPRRDRGTRRMSGSLEGGTKDPRSV